MMTTPPGTLLNRELGILEFNARVLAQAADPNVPLLERLKFICIVSSNLDEFFEIRMAGLKEQMRDNASGLTPDGLSFLQTYQLVTERTQRLVASQYDMLQNVIFPALEQEGVFFSPDPHLDRRPAPVGTQFFHPRAGPGADADRAGSGASVSARPQQYPEFRSRTVRQGRARPRRRPRHGAGAARAAALMRMPGSCPATRTAS